jgi:hypothetical protein
MTELQRRIEFGCVIAFWIFFTYYQIIPGIKLAFREICALRFI